MEQSLDISAEFQQAFDLFENSKSHLFITGKAGSGKSTWLDYCCRKSAKNIVVLAPTGVAALNVHGQTIHRFFGFPINISVEKIKNKDFTPRAKRIYKRLDTLIIDEVSMLRADILDCIDTFLKMYGPKEETPFGGVQMIFVGDLYQLPPVISRQEETLFKQKYISPYFFSADVFKSIPLKVLEFTTIYRQKDTQFIALLNRIRSNKVTGSDINLLNTRVIPLDDNEKKDSFRINLTTVNQLANDINSKRMEALDGQLYISHAVIDGTFSTDYYPTSENLEFKLGAQIMFLNNDSKNRWVNGSIGHIENICLRDGNIRFLKVRLHEEQTLVDVFPYTWEIYKYTLQEKELIAEVAGSFTQFPFRPAWAVTIHKSQGKTFSQVDIDIGQGTFATGQLYVALSRCRSFEGLRLAKPVSLRHILTDWHVAEFMKKYQSPLPLSEAEKITFLTQAAQERKKIEIIYHKTDGNTSHRTIIPIRIIGENLLAFCVQRQAQRSFNLSRLNILE